jgi:hypothetical protein
MVDICIDKAVPFVVLVNNVKRLSVPKSEEKPCPILCVVAKNPMQSAKLVLQVAHLVGSSVYLLESTFSFQMQVFAQDLH